MARKLSGKHAAGRRSRCKTAAQPVTGSAAQPWSGAMGEMRAAMTLLLIVTISLIVVVIIGLDYSYGPVQP